ncbi:disease resistance protein RUN1-like [Telopea speciosissima]|uniref:disease resistance protein RUN1-like n=1 Tax=Telopea speciosissima TaxID=54955 RepID=UPI001CC6E527|nr:disease resistance protein RUN1-like [Telopea speciosissima]
MGAEITYGACSSTRQWKYDVFLSFCGQDTRTNFTDFLFNWLVRDGIRTFRDDKELNRGENISSELMEAIESSRIAIIVFSENYASSTWCLTELVKILDCKKNDGQIEKVIPVFYKVDPSDVRHQRNTYEKAFKEQEEHLKDKMDMWRAALTEAANMAGWDQRNFADGHEAELVKKVVEEVLTIVNQTCLHVAKHPIGLDSHIEHIGHLLKDGLDGRIIGIYGSGGIGKTTIAKAVFNDIFKKFEGSSFLANVREVSSQHKGLALLQKQLLSDILTRKDIDIDNEDSGIIIIKERLRCKRVLIILDDVDEMKQFDKLVGGRDCFGPGSRIVVTTRDDHLLNILEVDEKYRVKTMNQYESLQLFSRFVFQQNYPSEDYVQLSNDVIHYAGGLPLALVILGSLLSKRSQAEWERELEKLRKIPNGQILETLEISYNALDDFDRIIFLDISCFFIGKDKNYVITILDACGLGGEAGIKLLTERSLVAIDDDNNLYMHDLIRDMGREIVRKQSPQKPGGRSRLWDTNDAIDVLINLTGTDAVEGLQLNLDQCNVEEFGLLTIEGFSKMPNLRLLEVNGPGSSITIDWKQSLPQWVCCFKNLVWVSWEGFPFEYIPNNFHLGKLVILDMKESKLKEVWKGTKYLTKLKDLNLSNSKCLTRTPDFAGLPNLEKLILGGCDSLYEVHESIDCLKKLVKLDLGCCSNLRNLPSGISKLSSLETVDISICSSYSSISRFEKLPERIGNLTGSWFGSIQKIPFSFELPNNLTTSNHSLPYGSAARVSVSFDGCCSLKHLTLENCKLTDDNIPEDFWMLYSLESLNLSLNNFESLPSSIGQLSKLETLKLWDCQNLKSLSMLPSSLRSLDASYCSELKGLPNLSNLKHLRMLDISFCEKLTEIEGLEGLKSATTIKLNDCTNLKGFVKKRFFQDISKDLGNHNVCDILLSGYEIPEWFRFQSESSNSLSCEVTQLHNMEMQGLIICIVFSCTGIALSYDGVEVDGVEVVVFNESKNHTWKHEVAISFDSEETATCVLKIPNCVWKSIAGYGDSINVSLPNGCFLDKSCQLKKIGVHFFYASHNMRVYRRKILKHH